MLGRAMECLSEVLGWELNWRWRKRGKIKSFHFLNIINNLKDIYFIIEGNSDSLL